jgi:hypothetical protein
MPKLIPLSEIPNAKARAAEREARKQYPTKAAALEAAQQRIVRAEGCSDAGEDYGWLLTTQAASAVADQLTRIAVTSHHELAWKRDSPR